MNSNHIRKLIASLQLVMRCPGCGKKYNLDEIFLRGSSGSSYFLQLDCSNCHTPVYATIALTGSLKTIAQNIEKLHAQEIPETEDSHKKLTQITSDEIIEAHQVLQDFNGDFESQFNE